MYGEVKLLKPLILYHLSKNSPALSLNSLIRLEKKNYHNSEAQTYKLLDIGISVVFCHLKPGELWKIRTERKGYLCKVCIRREFCLRIWLTSNLFRVTL